MRTATIFHGAFEEAQQKFGRLLCARVEPRLVTQGLIKSARGQITVLDRKALEKSAGENGNAINSMLQSADRPTQGIIATIVCVVTLLFAAIGVVVSLR